MGVQLTMLSSSLCTYVMHSGLGLASIHPILTLNQILLEMVGKYLWAIIVAREVLFYSMSLCPSIFPSRDDANGLLTRLYLTLFSLSKSKLA